jgi:hypothetical protein
VGGTVAPNEDPPGPHSVISDEGTPFGGPLCECHELQGDGILDLSMKFSRPDVDATLELSMLPPGSQIELVVTGELSNGCVFVARDCVRLVPPGTSTLAISANLPGVTIDVSPTDYWNRDSGIASFDRVFSLGSIVIVTAPATIASHPGWVFVGWEVNGMPSLSREGAIAIVSLVQDQHVVAVYEQRAGSRGVLDELMGHN